MKEIEYHLSKEQQTTVRALANQRRQIYDQVEELNAAIQDLAARYAAEVDAVGHVDFLQKGPNGPIVLIARPPAETSGEENSPG